MYLSSLLFPSASPSACNCTQLWSVKACVRLQICSLSACSDWCFSFCVKNVTGICDVSTAAGGRGRKVDFILKPQGTCLLSLSLNERAAAVVPSRSTTTSPSIPPRHWFRTDKWLTHHRNVPEMMKCFLSLSPNLRSPCVPHRPDARQQRRDPQSLRQHAGYHRCEYPEETTSQHLMKDENIKFYIIKKNPKETT